MKTSESKVQILFVDDEPNILDGLRRSLFPMNKEWEMSFATSANEALELLEKGDFQAVVTDMRMPGMDGAGFLEIVQEKYPQAFRIILSGNSDENLILRSVRFAHQFLAKPCPAQTIIQTVNTGLALRQFLNNPSLIRIITGVKALPSWPLVYQKLLEELGHPDPNLRRISGFFSQDPVMTVRVLQIVNSAFFGSARHVTRVEEAVVLLGLRNLRGLVVGVGLFTSNIVDPRHTSVLEEIWDHCPKAASLAQGIARLENCSRQAVDYAFLAGMVHEIGRLVLLQVPGYFEISQAFLGKGKKNLIGAEEKLYGTTHAEVGAYLLGLWGFPEEIVSAVAGHHRPPTPVNHFLNVPFCVYLLSPAN